MYTYQTALAIVRRGEDITVNTLRNKGRFAIPHPLIFCKDKFWCPGWLDLVNEIYPEITLQFFDTCVHHGINISVEILQKTIVSCSDDVPGLLMLKVDGILGVKTLASLHVLSKNKRPVELNYSFLWLRDLYLMELNDKYGGKDSPWKAFKAHAQMVYSENCKHFNL